MREYELTVLIHPDLEADLEKSLGLVRDLVTTNGGEVVKENNWGKKRLAYTIDKEDFAVYVLFDVKLPAPAPLKIVNALTITDGVMRHLLVKVEEKERNKLAAAQAKSVEAEQEEE